MKAAITDHTQRRLLILKVLTRALLDNIERGFLAEVQKAAIGLVEHTESVLE